MKTSSRQEQELFILECASCATDDSPDLSTLLSNLGLAETYAEIVIRVLHRGKWRTSEQPMETVRLAALRTVFRNDSRGRSRKEISAGLSPEGLSHLAFVSHTSRAVRGVDGVWRPGGGRDAIHEEETERLHFQTLPVELLPPDLRTVYDPPGWLSEITGARSREVPDWEKIAAKAGLDRWESEALSAMALGHTRYSASQSFEAAADRRALEAAWRRLERSSFRKIRAILILG